MKRISYWSRDHVWTTRLLIIFLIYPILNLVGWFLGDLLQSMEIEFNSALSWLLCAVVILAFALYPSGKGKGRKQTYAYRKTLDIILISATFCLIVITGNGIESSPNINTTGTSYAATSTTETKTIHPEIKKKKKSLMKMIRELRKKYRDADKGTKVLLIILAVLVFLGLTFLLGALSCNIACSGAEGGAYVVFFLGLAALVWGLVKVIKRINKGPKKKEAETPAPSGT